MADQLLYRVPYEVKVEAVDLGSGKAVNNILHFRCGLVTAPAVMVYAAPLAGGMLSTFMASFIVRWRARVLPLLNHNYSVNNYKISAILGYGYGGIFSPIGLVGNIGGNVGITTVVPHGLVNGDQVFISGSNPLNLVNGIWTITVFDATHFTLNGLLYTAPAIAPMGNWQKIIQGRNFLYGDNQTQAGVGGTDVGGIAGDAMTLFSALSVRKKTSRSGRSFRGRISFSPMSESDQVDGRFTAGRITAQNLAMAQFQSDTFAGGSAYGDLRDFMFQGVLAKTIALAQVTPWTGSDVFMDDVASLPCQPNFGSIVRRKPRLTAPIT
jgi:hypothetical protein